MATISKTTHADQITDTMAERVDAMVAAGREAAGELKDKALDKALAAKDAVVDTGGTMVHSLSKAIKRRPITSVLVAFGIGYVAMRFVRMRD